VRACILCFFLLTASVSCQTADEALTFEIASVKLHVSQPGESTSSSLRGGPGTDDPGRIVATNRLLRGLIIDAWGIRNFQIEHPPWMAEKRYDIVAKVPAGATKPQARAMMRNLLTRRFALEVRREERPLPVYDLTVGKGSLKMKANDESVGPPQPDSVRMETTGHDGKLTVQRQTLSRMVTMLTEFLDRPVINRTGLQGRYDYTVTFSYEPGPGADFQNELAIAFQQQTGLKLNTRKEPVKMLIVVSARQVPTEN